MMTSSNEKSFRVTGHLCGEFTGTTQRPVTRRFDVYFDLRPDKRLSKQSWGWWFETLSHSLWRHRNGSALNDEHIYLLTRVSACHCITSVAHLFPCNHIEDDDLFVSDINKVCIDEKKSWSTFSENILSFSNLTLMNTILCCVISTQIWTFQWNWFVTATISVRIISSLPLE